MFRMLGADKKLQDKLYPMKTALLLFFVHIFVDTKSITIIQSLKRGGNGLLSLDSQIFDTEDTETKSLCERLCEDLEDIAVASRSVPQSKLEEQYRYCEAVNLFTKLYFAKINVVDLTTAGCTAEECNLFKAFSKTLKTQLGKIKFLQEYQSEISGSNLLPPKRPINQLWQNFVSGLSSELKIKNTKGSVNSIGPGVMKVAKELYVKEEHSKYLATCIRDRILISSTDNDSLVEEDAATQRTVLLVVGG